MSQLRTPFRFDYVGSFLRPKPLKEARARFAAGEIDRAALTAVEDEAIAQLIATIKALGYHVITDGEFRRSAWHLDFMWGFAGVGHKPTRTGLPFHGEAAMIDDTFLVGPVGAAEHHPFVDHFTFVQRFEDENTVAKQTIPAPAQTLAQFAMPFNWEATSRFYGTRDALADDIVGAYVAFGEELYAAGCRNLQFDDCTWGMLADESAPFIFGVDEEGLLDIQRAHKDINNAVIDALPRDLVVNTHVCRGNYHSTYASAGAYTPVAEVLFGEEHVGAFYLEFDDERSGGFEPLAAVPDGKQVVLGLVTTKRPELEDRATVIERIREASAYVPLERLNLSPQCGFASCEIGNKLTEDEQWAKLELVRDIAREVWGAE